MKFENILEKTTTIAKSASNKVSSKYTLHVRKKAIKQVSKTLKESNLSVSDIEPKDYEAMVSDAIKDINSNYSKKTAQVGLSLFGLDLIFGL